VRRSARTPSKKAALEYESKLTADLWRQTKLGEKPGYTWDDAVLRWVDERGHLRSARDQRMHLRWLQPRLTGSRLVDITPDRIKELAAERSKEGVTNTSVNRMLEVLRAILRAAERRWNWIAQSPTVPMLPAKARRVRWITRDEADRLLAALPPHTAAVARFSLATGLRKANVLGLTWDQVDLNRRVAWIHHDQAKAGKPIAVPLNTEALEVLREQRGKHAKRVFSYKGGPIREVNTKAWRMALKRAGIGNFRWHDLRHTWASWHVQNGTPLHALQELGGWATFAMVLRYAHLSADHLAAHAENVTGTKPAQSTDRGSGNAA